MKVLAYNSAWREAWDDLVDRSPQGTFLFKRGYMEYHAHRFADFSLLVVDDRDKLIAALPANIDKDTATVNSHGGLTYGGFVTDAKVVNANVMLEVFDAALEYMRRQGVKRLIYKPVPTIYHKYPAEDDLYALFRHNAKPTVVNISSTIDLTNPLKFDTNAQRCVKFARSNGVTVADEADLAQYWELLTQLLRSRYNTTPVHSLDEMRLLMSRFPDNIRLHCAYSDGGELLAGVLMYVTPTVAHSQYIAASDRGKELKVLPLLFEHLIQLYTSQARYFDFGISNEQGGRYLNAGLLRQKAGMGGRGVAYSTWEIDLTEPHT